MKRKKNPAAALWPWKSDRDGPNPITGQADEAHICTSHVERNNLNFRMHLRRFTRLVNAFNKKLDNLKAAVALYVAWYNFCRIHRPCALRQRWNLESPTTCGRSASF